MCEDYADQKEAAEPAGGGGMAVPEHGLITVDSINQDDICRGCGMLVDNEVCHCGTLVNEHDAGDGHSPVPMGCICHLNYEQQRQ